MNKSFFKTAIIALLCLPLFFINVKSSHDWGDDFAQYIHQAKNIVKGIPQTNTGYIFNEQNPLFGPRCYPIGFPLLLAPVYAIAGNSIHSFDLLITSFLFLSAIIMFIFYRKHFSSLVAGILVLVFIYNPFLLNFKMDIMSDIPFIFFLLLCTYLYQSLKPFNYQKALLLALLAAFLISIRNIGVIFIITVFIDSMVHYFRNRKEIRSRIYGSKEVLFPLVIASGGLIGFIILNKIIFHTSSDGFFSYSYFFDSSQIIHLIQKNLNYNVVTLRGFFETYNGNWNFISIICSTIIVAFIILGMIRKRSEHIDFIDTLVLLYSGMVIIYPYSSAGIRFLLPVVPYFLYYSIIGMKSLKINLRMNHQILAVLFGTMILFTYKTQWINILNTQDTIIQGPQEPENQAAFDYIIHNLPEDARINFTKPRALALYADRSAYCDVAGLSAADINDNMSDNNIGYILVNNDIADDSLKAFVRNPAYPMKVVWSNSKNTLYEK